MKPLRISIISLLLAALCFMGQCYFAPDALSVQKPSYYESVNLGHTLMRGCRLFWLNNSGSGDFIYDESWNSRSGTITGGTWNPGPNGWTVTLDGTNDLITAAAFDTLSSFSYFTRFIPATVSGRHPIADYGWITVYQQDDDIVWGFTGDDYTDRTSTASTILAASTPISLMVTKLANEFVLYADGFSVDTLTDSNTALTSLTNLIVGSDSRTAFVFPALTPANLTGENAIVINASDLLQILVGSASLNSAVVAENWNGNQMAALIWVKLNFVPGDGPQVFLFQNGTGDNQIKLLISAGGVLSFRVTDKDNTEHIVSGDITGWSPGEWHQVAVTLDFKTDLMALYTDGSVLDNTGHNLSSDSFDALSNVIFIGSDFIGNLQLNGSISILAENRSWSAAEITADYDAGAGTPRVVGPNTLFYDQFTDLSTGVTYHPRGKGVSAIVNGATESTLTTDAGADTAFPVDNEEVIVEDATGFSVSGFIDGAASDTSVDVDDGAGALVTDIEKVGVFADLNGSSHYFRATDANFPAAGITGATDKTIQLWIKPNNVTDLFKSLASKYQVTGDLRMYSFEIHGTELRMKDSTDGTEAGSKVRLSTNASLVAGVWQHVAITCDTSAGTCIYYKNGVALTDDGVALNTSIADKTPDLEVGSRSGGSSFFNDGIRNVALFNDIRTAAEILTSATTPLEDLSAAGNIIGQWLFTDAAAVTQIDNNEGTAGGDLDLQGGTTTNYGTHTRTQEAFVSRNLFIDIENGGIGNLSAGDAATTLTKDTSTVFSNSRSLKVLNGDGTQSFARYTLATVTGNDYLVHARFFAPTTINGASQLVDVDTTAALGITATQAGIVAGWNEVEFTFEAADGSTTIDLGSGSVTNTEFGFWDSVQVLEQLVTQPGCEAADGNALPTGWSDTGSPDADETQTDSADQHAGATSILLNNCDADEGVTQDVTVVVDEYYTLSFWEKNNSQDINAVLSGAATATIDITGDNSWTEHSFTFKAATTTLTIKFTSGAADQSSWIDDVTVNRVDQRAASTATRTRDFADGNIDEVQIWDRALHPTEAKSKHDYPYQMMR